MKPQLLFRSYLLRSTPLATPIQFSLPASETVWIAYAFSGERFLLCMN